MKKIITILTAALLIAAFGCQKKAIPVKDRYTQINIGAPDAGAGDNLYTAFTKVNANFAAVDDSLALKAPIANPNFTGVARLNTTDTLATQAYARAEGGGSSEGEGVWGGITGTLSDQTDLQSALNAKAPTVSPTFTISATLPAATSIGNVSSTEISYVDGARENIQEQLDDTIAVDDLFGGVYNVMEYGAIGNGTTDDATAIQSCITAAGVGGTVYFPDKSYRINSTLNILNNQKLLFNNAIIYADIDDGSAAIHVPKTYNWWNIKDVAIFGYGSTWHNFIGLQIGDGLGNSNDAAYYGKASNIIVFWAHKGIEVNGYTIAFDGIQTRYCGTGFDGYGLNNVSIYDPIFENDTIEFNIKGGSVIYMSNVLYQGSIVWRPSRIDGASEVIIDGIYFENSTGQDSSLLIIGGDSRCENINIENVANAADMDGLPLLKFDDVNGIKISGDFIGYAWDIPYETTSQTRDFKLDFFETGPTVRVTDNNYLLGQRYNYFPNGSFEAYLRGYSDVVKTSVVTSQVTDTVRSGTSALKILSDGTYCQVYFFLNDVTCLQGKMVTLGAWIWVPEMAGYENSASRTILPNIILTSSVGANTNSTYQSAAKYFQAGRWNFYTDKLTVQDDATSLYLQIYSNHSGTSNEVNYIYVDDIQIVEGNVPEAEMINTTFQDAPHLSATIQNRKLILSANAAPTDVDQIFADGDQVWKKTTVAGESPGWICTTGGAGGTAVWAPMPVLGTP
jgi:hypothetical protein